MVKPEKDKKTSLLLEDLSFLESYVHDLFTFAPLPICFVSPRGVILEANPAFEKISKFDINEIIGEPSERVFEKKEFGKLTQDTFKDGFIEGREMKFFPKEEKEISAHVFTRVRKDEKGASVGFFLGLFDLTEIKRTEKELKEAQAALLNILEDTKEARREAEEERNKTLAIIQDFADGLLVFDKEEKLVLINPQAENFFEIKAKQAIGRQFFELSNVAKLKPLVSLLTKKVKRIFRQELKIGAALILEVSTVPLKVRKEKIGEIVILHDITREKAVEKMKTEFVSLAAHQLRTPLSAIKWTLKMLLDGDLGKISKEQQGFIQKTYQSNERMISLVNALLDVTRIEEGRYLYKPVFSQIEDIIQFVVNSSKERAQRKEIKVLFKKPEIKLPELKVDVEKIRLVIQNLLDNAIAYTPRKGEVTICLKRAKKKIEVQIQDTGVGIPAAQQKRVFTKFFRGSNVIKMETEGTGLGLFIAKNIVEAHRGKIWFESEEKKGTTFYFVLPLNKK